MLTPCPRHPHHCTRFSCAAVCSLGCQWQIPWVKVGLGLAAAARSYFPLFPPPAGALLDAAAAARALPLPCSPDLLLLPSDLAPFARSIPLPDLPAPRAGAPAAAAAAANAAGADAGPVPGVGSAEKARAERGERAGAGGSVVCVNPGRLAKGSTGGTFALLRIGAAPEGVAAAAGEPPATNAPLAHRVSERCMVEIRRV